MKWVVLLLPLCACNPIARQSDIQEMNEKSIEISARIAALQDRIEQIEHTNESRDKLIDLSLDGQANIADTISKNAKIANENAARDMTLSGACGKEWIQLENGQYMQRNIKCTVKDLSQ